MSTHVEHKVDSQSLIYYNAALYNPETAQPIPAAVSDTRSSAIIERPEEWECSVVRFDISADSLPSMVLPMPQPPVASFTAPTLLTVTLQYLGVDYQQTATITTNPGIYGQLFNIDALMFSLNNAIAAAFALIPGPSSTEPPVLVFNPVTQLVSVYYQSTYVTAANPVHVWFNSIAYNYIRTIPAVFRGYNRPMGLDYQIQPQSGSAITLPAAGARAGLPTLVQTIAGELRALSQVGPTPSAFNGVRSVFVTTSMPINSESLPQAVTAGQNASSSSNSLPILSDFLLGVGSEKENPVANRGQLLYLPTAEYRMVQMRGREPLKRVELQWFFSTFDGQNYPFTVRPGGYLSAKILFRRVV